MSVLLEFSIPGQEFQLGRVLSGPPEMHLELERIVPTGRLGPHPARQREDSPRGVAVVGCPV